MADLGNSAVLSQTDSSNGTGTMPSWLGSAAPSTLDDAGRALQGAVTREWNWRNYTLTATGTADAKVLTYSVAPAAYYNGQRFSFLANTTNTGTATLNVNSLGAVTIKKDVSGTLTALSASDMVSGMFVEVAYNTAGSCFVWVNRGIDLTAFVNAAVTAATGRLLRAPQVLTSGTSYTTPANCTGIYVECVGGGGGGGGNPGTANSGGSGGGAGGYCAKFFTVTASNSYAYAIGAGGTSASNTNGGTGGATTFTVGGTTITANGGTGGSTTNAPGIGGTCTNGDINTQGGGGTKGNSLVNAVWGGSGGNSVLGGGASSVYDNNGNNGGAYGGGGSASSAISATARAGGTGSPGAIRIWEYV